MDMRAQGYEGRALGGLRSRFSADSSCVTHSAGCVSGPMHEWVITHTYFHHLYHNHSCSCVRVLIGPDYTPPSHAVLCAWSRSLCTPWWAP